MITITFVIFIITCVVLVITNIIAYYKADKGNKVSNLPGMTLRYSYRVFWSCEDMEFVGVCDEFSYLSYLDKCPSNALLGIINLVHSVVKEYESEGKTLPLPTKSNC